MTPTQRQAMEQALEALEFHLYHYMPKSGQDRTTTKNAITSLRAALAETAEPVACLVRHRSLGPRAEIAADGVDHYSEWSEWTPQSLAYGLAVTNPLRVNDGTEPVWEMQPLCHCAQPPAPAPEVQEPVISTAHGPWVDSTLHEGEKYCKWCLTRSIFADKRKCEPHPAAAHEARKGQP